MRCLPIPINGQGLGRIQPVKQGVAFKCLPPSNSSPRKTLQNLEASCSGSSRHGLGLVQAELQRAFRFGCQGSTAG